MCPPSTAEQLPSTGAPSRRKSTISLPFIGSLTQQQDPRWVEAHMDIVENCQSVDGQTSVKIFFSPLSLHFPLQNIICIVFQALL